LSLFSGKRSGLDSQNRRGFREWGMQALKSTVTKFTKVGGKQTGILKHRKKFFFLRHGLSYKLYFWVTCSPKFYLTKDLFWSLTVTFFQNKFKIFFWQMVFPSPSNLITLLFWQFSRYFEKLPYFLHTLLESVHESPHRIGGLGCRPNHARQRRQVPSIIWV
jgi:hypothetical protein